MSAKSSTSLKSRKPSCWEKPYPEFPLSYHPPSGRLYKKIKGNRVYFGYAADWEKALEKYQIQRDDLFAGRTPRATAGETGISVSLLADHFLNAKRRLIDSGELAPRTFAEYHSACARMVESLGRAVPVVSVTPDDFGRLRADLARTRGPVALGNEIQRIRSVFKFGHDEGLIPQPVKFGQSFDKPSKKTLRIAKATAGPKMYEAEELRAILAEFEDRPIMRAAVLLGLNAGFGATDLGSLVIPAVDLQRGWVAFPRPKTGIQRRAKLWPETVEALREVLAVRPSPQDAADKNLVFLNERGRPLVRATEGDDPARWAFRTDLVGNAFARATKKLELNGHGGFYSLRHVCQTVSENCRDFPAIKMVMGHADSSMSGTYRERIEDARLELVAKSVHDWLWPAES